MRRYFSLMTKEMFVSESPLCAGDYADTCAAQCSEQLAGDTRSTFHVFAYDSDSGQILFCYRVAHITLGAFECEFFVQYSNCQVCICIPDGKCRIVFPSWPVIP